MALSLLFLTPDREHSFSCVRHGFVFLERSFVSSRPSDGR